MSLQRGHVFRHVREARGNRGRPSVSLAHGLGSNHGLKAQARFYAGETEYSPAEVEQLRDWLNTGPAEFYQLFTQDIMRYKDASWHLFPGSTLHRLFKELGQLN